MIRLDETTATPDATDMNWREHITVDPDVCHGSPCFAGTRIPVSAILDNLAAGVPADEIASDYPGIGPEQLAAALAYSAARSRMTNEKTHTTPYDVAEHLRNPEEAAAYIQACIEDVDGDGAFVDNALGDVARALEEREGEHDELVDMVSRLRLEELRQNPEQSIAREEVMRRVLERLHAGRGVPVTVEELETRADIVAAELELRAGAGLGGEAARKTVRAALGPKLG